MGRGTVGALALTVALAAPGSASAKPVKLKSGSLAITFDINFGVKLVKFGVTPGAIAPSVMDGLVVTSPFRSGSTVKRDGSVAVIKTAGGVSQIGDSFDIELQQLRVVMRGRTGRLSAFTMVNGLPTDRFTFATGKATSARRVSGGYAVKSLALKLNDIGSATLNSQLGTTDFANGELIGVATVIAKR